MIWSSDEGSLTFMVWKMYEQTKHLSQIYYNKLFFSEIHIYAFFYLLTTKQRYFFTEQPFLKAPLHCVFLQYDAHCASSHLARDIEL